MVEFAAGCRPDGVIGLGGGSPLDCAKGINLLLTNGGAIADYKGYGHARKPLLPMIAVPTTAGTGSEAQSYAVIADSATHMKMACGDPKLAFAAAVLDPELTVSQPRAVTAAAGFDAIAHAVETAVTTRRTPISTLFAHAAFRLLDPHYDRVLADPGDVDARAAMQLGAFYAGVAIEQSMLGAAHACANPLTARHALTHGVALAIHASARRALERGGRRRALRRSRGGRPGRPRRTAVPGTAWRIAWSRLAGPAGSLPISGPSAWRPPTSRLWPRRRPGSGRARSTRGPSACARPSTCTSAPTDGRATKSRKDCTRRCR